MNDVLYEYYVEKIGEGEPVIFLVNIKAYDFDCLNFFDRNSHIRLQHPATSATSLTSVR